MRLGFLNGYEISQLLHDVQPPDVNDSISTKKDRFGGFNWGVFTILILYTFFPAKKATSVSKKN